MNAETKRSLEAFSDLSKRVGTSVVSAAEAIQGATGSPVTVSSKVSVPLYDEQNRVLTDDKGKQLFAQTVFKHRALSDVEKQADQIRLEYAFHRLRNAKGPAADAAREELLRYRESSPEELRLAFKTGRIPKLVTTAVNISNDLASSFSGQNKYLKQGSRILGGIASLRKALGSETPKEQSDEILRQIADVEARLTELYNEGTPEALAEAEQLLIANRALTRFVSKPKKEAVVKEKKERVDRTKESSLRRALNKAKTLSEKARAAAIYDMGIGEAASAIFEKSNVPGARGAGLEEINLMLATSGVEVEKAIRASRQSAASSRAAAASGAPVDRVKESTLRAAANRAIALAEKARAYGVSDRKIGEVAEAFLFYSNRGGGRAQGLEAINKLLATEGAEIERSIAARRRVNATMDRYSSYISRYAFTGAISTVMGGIGNLGASFVAGGADGLALGGIGLVGQAGNALASLGRAAIITAGRGRRTAVAGGAGGGGGGGGGGAGGGGAGAGGGGGGGVGGVGLGIATGLGMVGGAAAFGVGLLASAVAGIVEAAIERGSKLQTDATSWKNDFNAVLGRGMRGSRLEIPEITAADIAREALAADIRYAMKVGGPSARLTGAMILYGEGLIEDEGIPANPLAPSSHESELRHRRQRKEAYRHYLNFIDNLKKTRYGNMIGTEGTRALAAVLAGSQMGLGSIGGVSEMAEVVGSLNVWGVDFGTGGRYFGAAGRSGLRSSSSPIDKLRELRGITGAIHGAGIVDDRAVSGLIGKLIELGEGQASKGIYIDQREQAAFFSSAVERGLRPDAALRVMQGNADARSYARDVLTAPGRQIANAMALYQAIYEGGSFEGAIDRVGSMTDAEMESFRRKHIGPMLSNWALSASGVSMSEAGRVPSGAEGSAKSWGSFFRDPLEFMRLTTSGGEADAYEHANKARHALTEESVAHLKRFNEALDDASSALRSLISGSDTMKPTGLR